MAIISPNSSLAYGPRLTFGEPLTLRPPFKPEVSDPFSLELPNDPLNATPFGKNDPFYFGMENKFSLYPSLDFSPTSVNFDLSGGEAAPAPEVSPRENLEEALKHGADYLSEEQIEALAPVAKGLGFSSSQNLVHALRNVPEELKASILNKLPDSSSGVGSEVKLNRVKGFLHRQSHKLVTDTFDAFGAKQPTFEPRITVHDDEMWNPQSLLSVYNSFQEMAKTMPAEHVKDMMEPDNGSPLILERKNTPRAQGSNDNLLSALSYAMKVAETNQDDRIILYNSAFTMNPKDIVESEDVQSFMEAFKATKDSEQASPQVESLQNMLNLILPDNRKLAGDNGKPTGVMDTPTVLTLVEFESQQLLSNAMDIVRDDKKLSAATKMNMATLIKDIKSQIYKDGMLTKDGEDNGNLGRMYDLVENLREMADTKLTPKSKHRLKDLEGAISGMETRATNRDLNPELLERVVGNWFSIIDSGERKDFAEQVINHELGHFLEKKDNLIESWANISFKDFEKGDFNASEAMKTTLEEGRNNSEFASGYATTNPSEDFAESYRLFTREPEALIQRNLLKYLVVAGAVNKYTPENYGELKAFALENGHTEQALQDAIKAIRGYSVPSSFAPTQDMTLVEEQGAPVELEANGESLFNPSTVQFNTLNHKEEVLKNAEIVARAATSTMQYQFDLGVSNYLPGIEEAFKMDTKQTITPDQSGFVLDTLTEHTENMESWRLFSSASRASHRFVKDFKENGLDAFPEDVRSQIPDTVRESFEKDSFRAIYLVLAELRSNPELAKDFMNTNEDVTVSRDFFNDKFGDLLKGLDVPPALRRYMSDPRNLVQITGNGGQNVLSPEAVERNAAQAIVSAQDGFDKVVKAVSGGDSSLLSDPVSLILNAAEGKFHLNSDVHMMEASKGVLEEGFFKGLTMGGNSSLLDADGLSKIMHAVIEQLNTAVQEGKIDINELVNDGEFDPYSITGNPEINKKINDIMLQELQKNIPEIHEAFSYEQMS